MKITKVMLESMVRQELKKALNEAAPADSISGGYGKYYPLADLEPIYAQVIPTVKKYVKSKLLIRLVEKNLNAGKGRELPSDIVKYAGEEALDLFSGPAGQEAKLDAALNRLEFAQRDLFNMEQKIEREEMQDEPEEEDMSDPEAEYDDEQAVRRTIEIAIEAGMTGPALQQLKNLMTYKRRG